MGGIENYLQAEILWIMCSTFALTHVRNKNRLEARYMRSIKVNCEKSTELAALTRAFLSCLTRIGFIYRHF